MVLQGTPGDVVTFATEHAAVLDCARVVRERLRSAVLPVTPDGRADFPGRVASRYHTANRRSP